MTVRMNALGADPPELLEAELTAVERVLRSGWWVLGNEVAEFERAWAQRVGATQCVGVANGMEALEIALMALDIGPGDEVITTPMTAFATVLAIVRVGATPVLADIDADTSMLDVASVERCWSPATKAVVLVHLYGQAGPAAELADLCAARGAELIEDCAQAHGALIDGRSVGTFGVVAAWSFYPTKNLGAVGDGGAITTSSEKLADRARVLRNYGQSVRYVHTELGMNSRLDELQAAILRVRLDRLDEWTLARRSVAQRYAAGITQPDVRVLPLPADELRHVHHLFVVTCDRRTELVEHLSAHGVESLSHYPIAVHRQSPTAGLQVDPAGLGAAERHAATCLSLPCHPYLSDDEVEDVIQAVNLSGRSSPHG